MSSATDISTEEKIKEAARIVFTQKGFQGAKIRDIALQADINLASVNYYFRSKEKLFEIIMTEAVQQLFDKAIPVVNDSTTTLIQKIEFLVAFYIDLVLNNPDYPFFIIGEVMSGSNNLPLIKNLEPLLKSHFARQLAALNTDGKIAYHPYHVIMNLAGMIIFPFISRPPLLKSGKFNAEEFEQMMQERKKLIPVWIAQTLGI
ncbi:TetR/AcrR family transcriptional regulator [Mucilaginibacter aquaedulcis]|jgi:AcrR family transcriptional regulator|uniref:TetR/AcrR family transcriptional regulator n=1 Tax=Mucilaginibacter aquaedulcis TaxID=1187081 RepID=UPI0025B52349|nr:TetR/AcrR family transcriptional regulator [Mucilaginibacter aquaedulcis]MDN3549383.1 TetR/AcrR family transcriptional regulator [Mucilaginibacter aquaedulcis]